MKYLIINSQNLFLFIGIAIFFNLNSFGQDLIIYQSGAKAEGKVIEVNDSEVLYQPQTQSDEKLIILDRNQVDEIIYENGSRMILNGKQALNQNPRMLQRRNFDDLPYKSALKVEILSSLSNHIGINYERSVKDKLGVELKLGIIGLGAPTLGGGYSTNHSFIDVDQMGNEHEFASIDEASREKGFFIKFGPKLMMGYDNSLHGWYFKPELVYSRINAHGKSMSIDPYNPDGNYDFTWRFAGNSAGVLANIGYQTVFAQRFSFDVNIGLGYTKQFDKLEVEGETNPYYAHLYRYTPNNNSHKGPAFRYSHSQWNGASITMGIAFGVLLK